MSRITAVPMYATMRRIRSHPERHKLDVGDMPHDIVHLIIDEFRKRAPDVFHLRDIDGEVIGGFARYFLRTQHSYAEWNQRVKELVAMGTPRILDKHYPVFLAEAARQGHDVVYPMDWCPWPLGRAAIMGDINGVTVLREHGVDVNYIWPSYAPDMRCTIYDYLGDNPADGNIEVLNLIKPTDPSLATITTCPWDVGAIVIYIRAGIITRFEDAIGRLDIDKYAGPTDPQYFRDVLFVRSRYADFIDDAVEDIESAAAMKSLTGPYLAGHLVAMGTPAEQLTRAIAAEIHRRATIVTNPPTLHV